MFQRFGRKSTLSKLSCRRWTGMGKHLLRHDFSEGFQGKSRFPDAVTQSGEDPKKNQTALSGSSFLPDSLKTGFRAARENAPPLRLKLPFSSANGFFRKASRARRTARHCQRDASKKVTKTVILPFFFTERPRRTQLLPFIPRSVSL